MPTYFGSTDGVINSDAFSYVYEISFDEASNIVYNVTPLSGVSVTMSDSLGASSSAVSGNAVANNLEGAGEAVSLSGSLEALLNSLFTGSGGTVVANGSWEAVYTGTSTTSAVAYGNRPPLTYSPGSSVGPDPTVGTDQPIIAVNYYDTDGVTQLGTRYFVLSNTNTPPMDANTILAAQDPSQAPYNPAIDYGALLTPATAVAGAYYYSCFEKNTLIKTPVGEVPVHQLKIGDLVLTNDGREVEIKWVGYQAINAFFAKKHDTLPVKLIAGALGDNLPKNDLYVSADHAFLIDGLLINAGALVNGETIIQVQEWIGDVEYYHLETQNHEIILAEGVPAETLLDNTGREKFANYHEFQQLYPQGKVTAELDLPRVKFSRQLPQLIKHRIAKIALELRDKLELVA